MTFDYDNLATIVQGYGWNFFHFLAESLPRVVLLKEMLGTPEYASTKVTASTDRYPHFICRANWRLLLTSCQILTWGLPYEEKYFEMLGISKDRLVHYNPAARYHAKNLLLPTPAPRITPSKEALLSLREALGIKELPAEERSLVVYASRSSADIRKVANEEELISALQAQFPDKEVVVHTGAESVDDSIEMFQKAAVVVGPHGAGLTHILF